VRISIIIPTFNRARLVGRAVQSALQAGGNPEVIVVDDASTDDTPAVCAEFQNVRAIRLQKNVGLGAARNVGIRASRGDYIALLDDDDMRLPDSLPAQIEALEKNPDAAFCYGQVLIGDCETGELTGEAIPKDLPSGDVFWRLLRGNFIATLSVVLRRQPLFDVALFDPKLRQVEDWDLWLRLSEKWLVAAVEHPVAIYRMFKRTSEQLSSNRALMARAAAAVQRRALDLPRAAKESDRARACRKQFLNETRYTLLHETIEALLAGAKKPARDYLFTVLRLTPGSLRSQEFRELSALASGRVGNDSREYQKRLKAVRKKLWASGPSGL
jgi:glycosyltransferase involved in cell wall biosynthesis